MQIYDSHGIPFFSRNFQEFHEIDNSILSGMVSAIQMIGERIFKENIATITFGEGSDLSFITIIQKDFFKEKRSINFVFFTEGQCETSLIQELSTTIFIDSKEFFRNPTHKQNEISHRVNLIIDTKFDSLAAS